MPRSLVFLALLAAGLGARAPGPVPQDPASYGGHGMAAPAAAEASAALRSMARIGAVVLLEEAGPAPRPVPRRGGHPVARPGDARLAAASSAAYLARVTESSGYLSAQALARAGRLAYHTTAPPPFRFV